MKPLFSGCLTRAAIQIIPTGRPSDQRTVQLDHGDVLLLYTDGVVEIADATMSEFGEARLARVLSGAAALSAREIISALVDATRAFAGQERYHDDFTLVVVKRCRLPVPDSAKE